MHRLLLVPGLLVPCLAPAAPAHWIIVRDNGAKRDRLATHTRQRK
jgi:hypothetical protein